MSHFSVMVLSKDSTDLDTLLAPFDENMEVEPYISRTKAQVIEEKRKEIEDYSTKGYYAEYLKDPEAYREKNKNNPKHLKYIEEEFPKKLSFTDEQLYQEEIQYYSSEQITEDGSIISTYNPKSKWDWYVVGGRFSDMLKLKNGCFVNSAYAKDIDFSVDEKRYKEGIRFWEIVVEGQESKTEEERNSYISYLSKEYYIKRYKTKENYAKSISTIHTYAILMPNGEWLEPGRMGWFGISHAEIKDEIAFEENFAKYIEQAIQNNWLITVVDCHI